MFNLQLNVQCLNPVPTFNLQVDRQYSKSSSLPVGHVTFQYSSNIQPPDRRAMFGKLDKRYFHQIVQGPYELSQIIFSVFDETLRICDQNKT